MSFPFVCVGLPDRQLHSIILSRGVKVYLTPLLFDGSKGAAVFLSRDLPLFTGALSVLVVAPPSPVISLSGGHQLKGDDSSVLTEH